MQLIMTGVVRLLVIGVVATPQIRAQSQAKATSLPSFEVASVKVTPADSLGYTSISPFGSARFTATNVTLELLIEMAFGVEASKISGEPGWLGSDHYDVSAKAEGEQGLAYEQWKPRLQQLLAQRFKLAIHHEMKDSQGYALVVAKGGPKLQKSAGPAAQGYILPGGLRASNASLDSLASMLASPTGRPVVNKTKIKGTYDIQLNYAPEGAADSPLPSIFTALQEQLGLKLEALKAPVEMLVIDHVERVPTEN
jgi:uncharacterized protein (TIGR03435 family)